MSSKKKPPALGRGLAALLGDSVVDEAPSPFEAAPGERIIDIPIERLEVNPYQPRRDFLPGPLESLAESIKEHGVLQPLVVRSLEDGYQIIAGERRLRASQIAGLTSVPAVVRAASDEQALLLALLENLQREDLGPLEEARAFLRLADEFSFSQEEIAQGVGKDRSTVANALRLLKLPDFLQQDLASGRISAGHGRALLMLESKAMQREAREVIVSKHLSVRATEKLVKSLLQQPAKPEAKPETQSQIYIKSLAEEIGRSLGTKVDIKRQGQKGRITIEFYSDDELENLIGKLK
jgi:ParB family chromosome partitioning protein